jgi:peptidoglycan hydrolase-like protein with peptidoglycan-binding domain
MWRRRVVGVMAAVVAAVGLAVGTAAPASAAPTCDSIAVYSGIMYVPGVGGNVNTSCVMGIGANSSGVAILQTAMRLCFGQSLTIDGDFGPQTRQAVRNVQGMIGARVDGVYGPETFNKMARTRGWPSAISSGCIVLH